MASNFAEAFFNSRNAAQDRARQQEADAMQRQQFDVQMQGAQQKQQASQQQALFGLAKGYKDYLQKNPQGGAQYYENFLRPSLAGLGLGDAGPYNEQEAVQLADQVLSAFGGQGGGEQFTLGPGSKRFDATGRVVAEVPFAPANAQYVDVPDGQGGTIKMLLDPRSGSFTQPNFGSSPSGPTRPDMEADIATANDMIRAGIPEARVDAFLKSRGERTQEPAGSNPITGGLGYTPPKPASGEETFSGPQPVTFPDGSVRLVQFGNRGSRREVEGVAPAPTDRDAKPPTEGERKAATLLQRLNFSLGQLQDAVRESPDAASPNVAASIGGALPFIGEFARNTLNPAERQRVEAAQLDILDAALTLGTGAAYTREQLEGYRKSYFPQLGDSEATVRDKAARLDNVVEAARIAAGRAAPESPRGNTIARPTTDAEYNALPSGALFIDPDDGKQYRKP